MARVEIDVVTDTKASLGEGILWCPLKRVLYWVDIPVGMLYRTDPETGNTDSWRFDQPLGCVAMCEGDEVILGLQSGFARFDPGTDTLTKLVDPEPDLQNNRLNDGAVSRDGRFFAGTVAMGDKVPAAGAIHRLDPNLKCTMVLPGLHVSNGLAFSPDNRILYVSDSWRDAQMIWACPYDAHDGHIGSPVEFFDTRDVAGRPDGACIDADGCYWMAGVGGSELVRITPSGKIDRRIPVPVADPTKPCFGGARMETLFFTSKGADHTDDSPDGRILSLVPGVTGLPEPRFKG